MQNIQPDTHLSKQEKANQSHYDYITDAWHILFGDNFHWGYFESENTDLKTASAALIDKLAAFAHFDEKTNVLDVGCGVGGPALYLHQKFGCRVTGISTSVKGLKRAADLCEAQGCENKVRFQFGDALDNGLPDNTFDIVWMMESLHLMSDKKRVFEENHRVLKDKGVMLACDNMARRHLTEEELVRYSKELILLQRVFGQMRHETLPFYRELLRACQFRDIKTIDVGKETYPTTFFWKQSVKKKHKTLLKYFDAVKIDQFKSACVILEKLYRLNIATYGMLKAVKRQV